MGGSFAVSSVKGFPNMKDYFRLNVLVDTDAQHIGDTVGRRLDNPLGDPPWQSPIVQST
jgi:hypothetical protein